MNQDGNTLKVSNKHGEIMQAYENCLDQAEKAVSQLTELMERFEELPPINWYASVEHQKTPATQFFQRMVGLQKATDRAIRQAANKFSRKQMRSEYYTYLFDVAKCEFLAYETLEETAQICAGMDNGEAIAEALAKNSAIDEYILLILCESNCYGVWLAAAKSPKAGKLTFARLARLCRESSFDYGRKDWYQKEIAKIVTKSELLDEAMVLDLACSSSCDVWRMVAPLSLADKSILTILSKKCVQYDRRDWEVVSTAMMIAKNKNSDDDSIYPLCESRFSEFWQIAAKSPYAGKRTLPKLARKCANVTGEADNHVREAVSAIIHHCNRTPEILSIIGNAESEEIRGMTLNL